jgi:hypothetical protein
LSISLETCDAFKADSRTLLLLELSAEDFVFEFEDGVENDALDCLQGTLHIPASFLHVYLYSLHKSNNDLPNMGYIPSRCAAMCIPLPTMYRMYLLRAGTTFTFTETITTDTLCEVEDALRMLRLVRRNGCDDTDEMDAD